MAGITQTIPNYVAGISQQSDQLKFPGQVRDVVNAIPDVTLGLFKRPGAERKKATPLSGVYSDSTHATNKNGSWFHYFRDETEGSYIGQVDHAGVTRMWRCSDGAPMTISYGLGGETAIKAYLTATTPEDLQFLTINDTTFVNNRDENNIKTQISVNTDATYSEAGSGNVTTITLVDHKLTVGEDLAVDFTSGSNGTPTDATFRVASVPSTSTFTITTTTNTARTGNCKVEPRTTTNDKAHFALVELLRTENGRQYGLNITNGTDDATRNVTLKRATKIRIKSQTLNEHDNSGECLGIGTEVFDITNDFSPTVGFINTGTGSRVISFTSDHGIPGDDLTNKPYIYHSGGGTKLAYSSSFNSSNSVDFKDLQDFYGYRANADHQMFGRLFPVDGNPSNTNLVFLNAGSGSQILRPAEKGVVVNSSGALTHNGTKKNLVFRITTLGQQGNAPGSSSTFVCSYQPEVTLLHGGEGWETGDTITVGMTGQGRGGGGKQADGDDTRIPLYTIEVIDHEETVVAAKYNSTEDGLIRPAITPFDADTAVTGDTILAGIATEINAIGSSNSGLAGQGIDTKIIGSTLLLESDTTFNIEVAEQDLMRVMQDSTNDVTDLPNQCKHGYIVKVKNARMADEDDYYLRFDGQNQKDGSGAWSECAKPNISKRLYNMPLVIQRTATTTFTISQRTVDSDGNDNFKYHDRRVGDDVTNPLPSFVTERINKVLFFRNRLALLSGENVVLSRPGTLGNPDFFGESALTVSASDPIDISSASMFPSDLFDGVEINAGLLLFSTNQQFLLSTDDTVLNPDTAKLRSVSTYNYNKEIPPLSLGTTVAYIDNSGKFSRMNEMANTQREGEPDVVEVSRLVPTLLPKDVDLFTNSRENSMVLIGKTESDTVFGYKYFNVAEKREQQAWFKWKLNNPLRYHFIINDEYYFLDTDNFLQCIRLVQSDDDIHVVQDTVNYQINLDNYTTITGGSYSAATKLTTFSSVAWKPSVTTPNYDLVIFDDALADDGTDTLSDTVKSNRIGRYAKTTDVSGSNNSFTVPGDWSSGTFKIGYLYEYLVEFPRLYPTRQENNRSRADVNSSLIVHRVKFHFGKVGVYRTTLERVGKDDYTEVYESTIMDVYDANDVPFLEEEIKTVPVYERNTNVTIKLKSSHPSPATLHSLSWEGDYSPRYYRRV